MKRAMVLAVVAVGATLACDDAHKVGDVVAQGGSTNIGEQLAQGGKNDTVIGTGGALVDSKTGTGTNSSSTSTHFGGASAMGGAAQSGASSGTAGASPLLDAVCTWPTVEFEFTVENPVDYCEFVYWEGTVDILSSDGNRVASLSDMPCSPIRCSDCKSNGCLLLGPGTRQAADVTTRSWDGSYSIRDSCGSEATTCTLNRCVAAGRYVARYCVMRRGSLPSCDELPGPDPTLDVCVEVPFEFPTAQVVRGRIGSSAGGGSGMGGAGGASGSTANGGSAGAAACLPGCTLENTQSPMCPESRKFAWVCGATNVYAEMLAAGCSDAATGAIRYCCPASFQTQCQ